MYDSLQVLLILSLTYKHNRLLNLYESVSFYATLLQVGAYMFDLKARRSWELNFLKILRNKETVLCKERILFNIWYNLGNLYVSEVSAEYLLNKV